MSNYARALFCQRAILLVCYLTCVIFDFCTILHVCYWASVQFHQCAIWPLCNLSSVSFDQCVIWLGWSLTSVLLKQWGIWPVCNLTYVLLGQCAIGPVCYWASVLFGQFAIRPVCYLTSVLDVRVSWVVIRNEGLVDYGWSFTSLNTSFSDHVENFSSIDHNKYPCSSLVLRTSALASAYVERDFFLYRTTTRRWPWPTATDWPWWPTASSSSNPRTSTTRALRRSQGQSHDLNLLPCFAMSLAVCGSHFGRKLVQQNIQGSPI